MSAALTGSGRRGRWSRPILLQCMARTKPRLRETGMNESLQGRARAAAVIRQAAGSVAALLLLASTDAVAGSPVNTGFFGHTAIKGYDPVAYQTLGRPVEGSGDYSYEWTGATWRFASRADLEKFKANPEKFAPQYGGYCAYAVGAKGEKVGIDPTAFTVVGGKLYLNYSKDIQAKWLADRDNYIGKADRIWPTIRDK
jgi:YHS domain-containing protein